jgi:hypothetical protein
MANFNATRQSGAMEFSKKINLFIYRFRERGLEVFLINHADEDSWKVPQPPAAGHKASFNEEKMIELEPVRQDNGELEKAVAVEADWHEIPSLREMLFKDALYLKDKLFEMEGGAFFAAKEAFKELLPHQYKQLKELIEVLSDRNTTKNI